MTRRSLVVVALRSALLPALLLALLSCKKGAPTDAAAATDGGDTTAATPAVSVAPNAPNAPLPPPAPTASVVSLAEALGTTSGAMRSWSGWYKCKQKLQLTHFESTITGRANAAPDDITLTCTLHGETCIGTETTIHSAKGKAPGAPKTRKLTLRRERNGTLQYTAEGNAQSCPKL